MDWLFVAFVGCLHLECRAEITLTGTDEKPAEIECIEMMEAAIKIRKPNELLALKCQEIRLIGT